jgi:hypothetical protein
MYYLKYWFVSWAMCPHYNFLSSDCGEITAGFIALRCAQAAFVVALVYVLVRLVRGLRK